MRWIPMIGAAARLAGAAMARRPTPWDIRRVSARDALKDASRRNRAMREEPAAWTI